MLKRRWFFCKWSVSSSSVLRLWLERWEGGGLRVRHHPADLWETHLRQQRRQPVLLRPHRAHPAWAGVGDVATIVRRPTRRTDQKNLIRDGFLRHWSWLQKHHTKINTTLYLPVLGCKTHKDSLKRKINTHWKRLAVFRASTPPTLVHAFIGNQYPDRADGQEVTGYLHRFFGGGPPGQTAPSDDAKRPQKDRNQLNSRYSSQGAGPISDRIWGSYSFVRVVGVSPFKTILLILCDITIFKV